MNFMLCIFQNMSESVNPSQSLCTLAKPLKISSVLNLLQDQKYKNWEEIVEIFKGDKAVWLKHGKRLAKKRRQKRQRQKQINRGLTGRH